MSIMTASQNVACGNRKAHPWVQGYQPHHSSIAEVRRCFTTEGGIASVEESEQMEQDSYDADAAYERHLEDAGWAEALAQEDFEARMGTVSFEEAAEQALTSWSAEQPQEPVAKPQQQAFTFLESKGSGRLLDGIYTLARIKGNHSTFKIATQADDAEFAPGQRILSVLTGPDNSWGSHDYKGLGFVTTDGRGHHHLKTWRSQRNSSSVEHALELLCNPEAALRSGHCFKCGRTLTTPESLADGVGPVCKSKIGI